MSTGPPRALGRNNRVVAVAILLISLGASARGSQNPGCVFLMIWPSARSTSMGGVMTAIADESDAAYWNPGGLGFQRSLGGTLTLANWLPGLYKGMYYAYLSTGFTPSWTPWQGASVNGGINITYLSTGEMDVVNERGDFLGRYTAWDGAFGVHGGVKLSDQWGVGINLKLVHSFLVPEWVWKVMPELGIESGGTGTTAASDIGILYRPIEPVSLGLCFGNIGPGISYTSSGESDPLPAMLRLGASYTLFDSKNSKVRLALELDKILVGMFYDTTGTKSSGRMLQEEMRDAWKGIAVEGTYLKFVSLRFGYFEDLTGQRGGVVIEKEGQTYHYGLGDILARRNLGRVKSVGYCEGLGIGYKDYIRLEFSDDHLIYDFPTTNFKIALTVNNLQGFLHEISSPQ